MTWLHVARDRVLIRAVVLDELRESDADQRQARLNAVAERWTLLALADEIIERARRPFPAEPVRTLDAIHLASALTARKAVPDLALLSLDARIRKAAARLGLELVPTDAELSIACPEPREPMTVSRDNRSPLPDRAEPG